MARFESGKVTSYVNYIENNDMEDICNFLAELELGAHILHGKLVAFQTLPPFKSVQLKNEEDIPLMNENDTILKEVSIPDMLSTASNIGMKMKRSKPPTAPYLRSGIIPLGNTDSICGAQNFVQNGTKSSNYHRRRSYSLELPSIRATDALPVPAPYSRGVTYPPSSSPSIFTVTQVQRSNSRLRSSSLSSHSREHASLKKPSKAAITHQLHLRELVTSVLSECYPDRAFEVSDCSLQHLIPLNVRAIMTQVRRIR